jgi:ATP-dependent Zn protease
LTICGPVESPEGYAIHRNAFKTREREINALCNRAKAEAVRFVAANRAAIEAVAAALVQKTSLTGDEVAAIVEAATTV